MSFLPDIDDDSNRPHVQRSVVAFVPQDLRGEIRWRADHRTPERLLTDDPSETEVAQLHLKREDEGVSLKMFLFIVFVLKLISSPSLIFLIYENYVCTWDLSTVCCMCHL